MPFGVFSFSFDRDRAGDHAKPLWGLCAIAELLALPFAVFLQPLCVTFPLQGCRGLIDLTLQGGGSSLCGAQGLGGFDRDEFVEAHTAIYVGLEVPLSRRGQVRQLRLTSQTGIRPALLASTHH